MSFAGCGSGSGHAVYLPRAVLIPLRAKPRVWAPVHSRFDVDVNVDVRGGGGGGVMTMSRGCRDSCHRRTRREASSLLHVILFDVSRHVQEDEEEEDADIERCVSPPAGLDPNLTARAEPSMAEDDVREGLHTVVQDVVPTLLSALHPLPPPSVGCCRVCVTNFDCDKQRRRDGIFA